MKTSELTGQALDWAVAKCEGTVWINAENFLAYYEDDSRDEGEMLYAHNWAQGGPIIGREGICLWCGDGAWEATIHGEDEPVTQRGNTPLIAAMRCYVASKLGHEVDIPSELTQGESK